MSNAIFPALPGLEWNVRKVPQWNTRVQRSVGGMELRATYYSAPLWKWTLSYEFLRETSALVEFSTLAGFYNARQGMYDSFLYSDPTDNTIPVSAPQQFGTGDGTTVNFYLARALGASADFVYNFNGTPRIFVNGVEKFDGFQFTRTGNLIHFAADVGETPGVGAAITWSGSWYWRVRFDQDSAEFANFAYQFWKLQQLSFVSIKGS